MTCDVLGCEIDHEALARLEGVYEDWAVEDSRGIG